MPKATSYDQIPRVSRKGSVIDPSVLAAAMLDAAKPEATPWGPGNQPGPMNSGVSPTTGAAYNYAPGYTAHQEGVLGDTTMNQNKSATVNQMAALNPMQVLLQNQMLDALMKGSGDFGLGSNMNQINATLTQDAARRGIDVNSDAFRNLLASVYASAAAKDAEQRKAWAMQVMTQNPGYYNALQVNLGKQQGAGFGDFAGGVLGDVAGIAAAYGMNSILPGSGAVVSGLTQGAKGKANNL